MRVNAANARDAVRLVDLRVARATRCEAPIVRAIIDEYCTAVGVVVRDSPEQLERYFDAGSGVWLASRRNQIVGCVALRPLTTHARAAEVKRLYVKGAQRGAGIADALLDALEAYARGRGYRWAYLDTKDDLRAAIAFYERRGYRPCRRYNDNPQATIFMRRQVGRER